MKNKAEILKKTLRIGLISILMVTVTACGMIPTCPTMPPMPAKPTLPSLTINDDGSINLDSNDIERLGKYVLQLERGYDM